MMGGFKESRHHQLLQLAKLTIGSIQKNYFQGFYVPFECPLLAASFSSAVTLLFPTVLLLFVTFVTLLYFYDITLPCS